MALADRVVARYLSASIPLGKTVELGTVRIHRYRDLFVATDLTNAGKRGKKVKEATIQLSYGVNKDRGQWMDSMSKAISDQRSYQEVISLVKDLLVDYPGEIDLTESEKKGVDVDPAGLVEISIKTTPAKDGSYLEITSKPTDWRVKAVGFVDLPDDPPIRMDTLYYPAGGKRSVKVGAGIFNVWLRENLSKANKMTILDLKRVWRDLKVEYDYH